MIFEILVLILLVMIYLRLHDMVTAIDFQGTIFDRDQYFNEPIKTPILALSPSPLITNKER